MFGGWPNRRFGARRFHVADVTVRLRQADQRPLLRGNDETSTGPNCHSDPPAEYRPFSNAVATTPQ
jgi:hypothetical protein